MRFPVLQKMHIVLVQFTLLLVGAGLQAKITLINVFRILKINLFGVGELFLELQQLYHVAPEARKMAAGDGTRPV